MLSNVTWGENLSPAENVLVNRKLYLPQNILTNLWVELEFQNTHGRNGGNVRSSNLHVEPQFFTKLRNPEIKLLIISSA